MTGWIKVHRKLSDNPLWTCEPFTRGQAWVDLIMLASFDDVFFFVRGIQVAQKRGQVCWSEANLADRWKWSRTKLRKFLNDLEKERQIIQQKNNVIQVITIVNYEEYQEKEPQAIQQKKPKKDDKPKEDTIFSDDFLKFIEWQKNNTPNILKMQQPFTEKEYLKLKVDFSQEAIDSMLYQMHNWKDLIKKCVSANLTFRNWSKRNKTTNEQQTTKVPRLIDTIHAK